MGLFTKSKSKNWDVLKNQDYKDTVKNRDVHSSQSMERGEQGETKKPVKERILAVVLASVFAGIGYLFGCVVAVIAGFYNFMSTYQGNSFLDFDMSKIDVTGGWYIYAWTGFVFLMAWLIANEKLMQTHRAKNSMNDATDINSYENDQHIMLPEEMQRNYDWFPDTGAHSNVQVSSLLSHMMVDRKGLKTIKVTERHRKDVIEDGKVIFHKGEAVVDENGDEVRSKQPLIDSKFGQELFTASGIPISEKEIRKPLDVKSIDYNPVNDTGNRKDRDKLDYDTVADLINKDWEFPSYEVQRPAGAYLVDTAPVNTMVLVMSSTF